MTTTTFPAATLPTYCVWSDAAILDFDTLEDARSYADSIDVDYYNSADIYRVEPDGCSMVYDKKIDMYIFNHDDCELLESVYENTFTIQREIEYNSPEAVAHRAHLAEEARLRREARLRARPVIVGQPAWQERYDQQADGSFRLKPQFR